MPLGSTGLVVFITYHIWISANFTKYFQFAWQVLVAVVSWRGFLLDDLHGALRKSDGVLNVS